MSSEVAKGHPLREYRRRRTGLDLDLNTVPPVEIPESEGPLGQDSSCNHSSQQAQHQPPATIDVEAIDDDVILSSPRAFAEARSKSQRNRVRPAVIDVESDERVTRLGHNGRNKRRRVPANHSAINCDLYELESHSTAKSKDGLRPSPSPPKPPTFSCPICLGSLVDGTTTKCGHIFCKTCIGMAVTAQGKCPTCRKAVAMKDLIRVFLPATT